MLSIGRPDNGARGLVGNSLKFIVDGVFVNGKMAVSSTYLTQSPNIALLSCLLRTLGIVSYIYAQYISCLLRTLALLSRLSLTQPCSNVLHTFTHAPRIRLWAPASRHITNCYKNTRRLHEADSRTECLKTLTSV